MATRTLINKKTKKEFKTHDAEGVLKKYPRAFILKPLTELDEEVLEKEKAIKEAIGLLDWDSAQPGSLERVLKNKKRTELDELAELKGLDPSDFRTKAEIISAIINPAQQEKQ